MNSHRTHWTVIAAVAGVVALAGCSSNQNKAETPAASSPATTETAKPSGEAEHGEPAETIRPAGSVAEIWTQIGDEQGKLSAAIDKGDLKDVHHLAFAIRDLVGALADKANAAAPARATKLSGLVEQVKVSADNLDQLGDSGNLSGTQTEYAKLVLLLDAIKAVAGTN